MNKSVNTYIVRNTCADVLHIIGSNITMMNAERPPWTAGGNGSGGTNSHHISAAIRHVRHKSGNRTGRRTIRGIISIVIEYGIDESRSRKTSTGITQLCHILIIEIINAGRIKRNFDYTV